MAARRRRRSLEFTPARLALVCKCETCKIVTGADIVCQHRDSSVESP